MGRTTLAIALAIVLVVTLLVSTNASKEIDQDEVSDVPPDWVRTEFRGSPPGWAMMEHPDSWYTSSSSIRRLTISSYDMRTAIISTGSKLVLTMNRSDLWSDDWPAGTVTETVVVDGVTGVKHSPPTTTHESAVSGWYMVQLDVLDAYPKTGTTVVDGPDEKSVFIIGSVNHIDGLTNYRDQMAILNDVIDTIRFVDDHLAAEEWDTGRIEMPSTDSVDFVVYKAKTDFSIIGASTGLTVTSQGDPDYAHGALVVGIEPQMDQHAWHEAEPVLGTGSLRQVAGGETISNGRRSTQYVLNQSPWPVRMTVERPVLDEDSQAYWQYRQAAWRIMHGTGVRYHDGPYP